MIIGSETSVWWLNYISFSGWILLLHLKARQHMGCIVNEMGKEILKCFIGMHVGLAQCYGSMKIGFILGSMKKYEKLSVVGYLCGAKGRNFLYSRTTNNWINTRLFHFFFFPPGVGYSDNFETVMKNVFFLSKLCGVISIIFLLHIMWLQEGI